MANSEIPLGIIPIGETSLCATALGIDSENACRILAARRIMTIDLGHTNTGAIFLSQISVTATNPVVLIDKQITATTEGKASIQVVNVLPDEYGYRGPVATPEDGRLNAYILKTQSNFLKKDISQSLFVCQKVELVSGPYVGILDGGLETAGVKEITVLPKALSVIVGKERKF